MRCKHIDTDQAAVNSQCLKVNQKSKGQPRKCFQYAGFSQRVPFGCTVPHQNIQYCIIIHYQLNGASNVYMGFIQTETPYFQSNPNAMTPFTANSAFTDPKFSSSCSAKNTAGCPKSWGLRIVKSTDVYVYGAGMYSFFDKYSQTCLATESCQNNMLSLESSSSVHLYGISTKGAVNMITVDGISAALSKDNTKVVRSPGSHLSCG
jgi:hypothetical protein